MSTTLNVKFATYGALAEGSPTGTQAAIVTDALQAAIDAHSGIVQIDNTTMNGDPAFGSTKHFGAVVIRNGIERAFACQEGQTINFNAGN